MIAQWTDFERDEAPVDDDVPTAPPCEHCGVPEPESWSLRDDWLCRDCAKKDREAREEEERRRPKRDFGADLMAMCAEKLKEFETTPHRCRGGCGEPVLRPEHECSKCTDRRMAEMARHERVFASMYTVPQRYRWAEFDRLSEHVTDAKAIERVRAVAKNADIDRLVLHGPAGAGKTSAAVATYRDIATHRGLRGTFVDARSLSFARSQNKLGGEPPIVTDALGAELLLLDDLGLDSPQQHGSAVVDVIYHRHADGLLTIVTLAIAPEDIAPRYGDGIARRLLEDDGHVAVVEVNR